MKGDLDWADVVADAEYGPNEDEPMTLDCYMCGAKEQKVVATGVSNVADPTQWYRLACGHSVI
jgi:hypothetical protein